MIHETGQQVPGPDRRRFSTTADESSSDSWTISQDAVCRSGPDWIGDRLFAELLRQLLRIGSERLDDCRVPPGVEIDGAGAAEA